MTKAELIDALAQKIDLPKATAERAVNLIFDDIIAACRALPRLERRACRDHADARLRMAAEDIELARLEEAPVLRLARAP